MRANRGRRLAPCGGLAYNPFNTMRQMLALWTVVALALVVSCGGDGGVGAVTSLPKNTFGFIDGTENGQVKYPIIEFWDISVCRYNRLVSNTPHGTRVRVLAEKARCTPVQYEVEILEGEKAGVRGWLSAQFLRFETATPSPD